MWNYKPVFMSNFRLKAITVLLATNMRDMSFYDMIVSIPQGKKTFLLGSWADDSPRLLPLVEVRLPHLLRGGQRHSRPRDPLRVRWVYVKSKFVGHIVCLIV